jgi:hypothetical protein
MRGYDAPKLAWPLSSNKVGFLRPHHQNIRYNRHNRYGQCIPNAHHKAPSLANMIAAKRPAAQRNEKQDQRRWKRPFRSRQASPP